MDEIERATSTNSGEKQHAQNALDGVDVVGRTAIAAFEPHIVRELRSNLRCINWPVRVRTTCVKNVAAVAVLFVFVSMNPI